MNETKLDPQKTAPKIRGYEVLTKSRDRHGGGVAIYYQTNLDLIEFSKNSRFEVVGIILDDTLYISLYNPAKFTIQEQDITELMEAHPKTVIIGDFNCRHTDWGDTASNPNGKKLAKICENKDYHIVTPDEPTLHLGNRSSIIDIAITKNVHINAVQVLQDLNTEHRPVLFEFDNNQNITYLPRLKRRNYSKANWKLYKKHIAENTTINREINSIEAIEETIQKLTDTINTASNLHIPLTQEVKTTLPPAIQTLIQERNRARRQNQRNPTDNNKIQLNIAKYRLEEALKEFNTEQWKKRIQADANKHGNVWKLVKTRKNPTSRHIPSLIDSENTIKHSPEEKAELIAQTLYKHHTMTAEFTDNSTRSQVDETLEDFHNQNYTIPQDNQTSVYEVRRIIAKSKPYKAPGPDGIQNIMLKKLPRKALVQIYYIMRACLSLNHFPTMWKEAIILPLKKPNKDSRKPDSYRPISLISNLGKILERIILKRLKDFDDRLQETQFGFRQSRTTELQLATLLDETMNNTIRKKTTALATIDLEKAYDTIWHKGLLFKLISAAIPGYLIKITETFLKERSYKVNVSGVLSPKHNIPAGVPQGSTLSPVLFLHYLQDLPENPKTTVRLFADDTAVAATSINTEKACSNVQEHLDELADYYRKWCLKVNPEKSTIITFDNKRNHPTTKIYYEATEIPYQTKIKYLGVTLDKKLNYNKHIEDITKRAKMAAYYIWPFIKTESNLEETLKIRLVNTYIRPILLYACPVWSSTNITNFQKLEVIENKCLRQILGLKPVEITNEDLWARTNWTRLSKIIYRRTKTFYEYKILALQSTENIGSTEIPDSHRKIKSKQINQLLLDYDETA